MDEELTEEGAERVTADASDVQEAVARIAKRWSMWRAGERVDLGEGLTWTPDLTSDTAVLHVHLAERLRPHIARRLMAAHQSGRRVVVAAELRGLYDDSFLTLLVELDAQVLILGERLLKKPVFVLKALAESQVTVSADMRTSLARSAWDARTQGTAQARGSRHEAMLGFLLSQVDDFRVTNMNLRTATEELDIVVQQRATSGRCWAVLGAPLIIVESKNWSSKVDVREVSVLHEKVSLKRGTVRIGLLFAANGFTGDAKIQLLKYALGEHTIALFGRREIEQLIDAEDIDDVLEEHVRLAMLR
jgi:hypothetical protein